MRPRVASGSSKLPEERHSEHERRRDFKRAIPRSAASIRDIVRIGHGLDEHDDVHADLIERIAER